ncbi:hypothetical protein ACWNYQ_00745 [Candidatus Vidania fulgoroideorum]
MSYKKVSYLVSNFNNSIIMMRKYFIISKSNYIISIIDKLEKINILSSYIIKSKFLICYYNYNYFNKFGYIKLLQFSKVSNKNIINKKNFKNYINKNILLNTNKGILTFKEYISKKTGGEVIIMIKNV